MNIHLVDNIHIHWKQFFHQLKKESRPILNKLGLTKVDANILLALQGSQQKTKADLAKLLNFKPNSLTRSLERLIELKLVNRIIDENDRRYIRLSLTEQGKKMTTYYIKYMRSIWIKAFTDIDSQRLATLDTSLKKMIANLAKP